MKLGELSDAQLLESLKTLCCQGRMVLARLLAHLVEVDERRLHLEAACPSLYQFCVRKLGMSEDEACRRIHAARLARRFPDLLVRIERGEPTLSAVVLLHGALTEATYEELVEAAAGKTKAEVQALLAKRSPMPDVPAAITSGPQLVPLSETRHKVQFTASDQLRQKLERAQDLMRHANADGDRCPATTWLELDHVVSRAHGGTNEPENLRVRCRAHNQLYAEQTFGKEHVERKIRERRHPRQRGYVAESCALAARGLVKMGFRNADVRRALDAVSARHPSEVLGAIPVQTILREALAVLT